MLNEVSVKTFLVEIYSIISYLPPPKVWAASAVFLMLTAMAISDPLHWATATLLRHMQPQPAPPWPVLTAILSSFHLSSIPSPPSYPDHHLPARDCPSWMLRTLLPLCFHVPGLLAVSSHS